jgi:hypothetical protein
LRGVVERVLLGEAAGEVVVGVTITVEEGVTMLEVEITSTVVLVASVDVGTTDELSLSKLEVGTAELDEVAWEVTDAGWVTVAEAEVTTVVGSSTEIDELEVPAEAEDRIVDAMVVEDSGNPVLETSEAVWVTGEETVVENSKLRGSVVSGSVDELRDKPISLQEWSSSRCVLTWRHL